MTWRNNEGSDYLSNHHSIQQKFLKFFLKIAFNFMLYLTNFFISNWLQYLIIKIMRCSYIQYCLDSKNASELYSQACDEGFTLSSKNLQIDSIDYILLNVFCSTKDVYSYPYPTTPSKNDVSEFFPKH